MSPYARGVWNTPENIGRFVRVATGSSGDLRTAVKEAFVVLGVSAVTVFVENQGAPVEEWGWKLDALIEMQCCALLGLPPDTALNDK